MGEIAPEEQFLPLSTIFYYLMLGFYVKTGIRFFLRDKRLFEITEVEITRVDCIFLFPILYEKGYIVLGSQQKVTSCTRSRMDRDRQVHCLNFSRGVGNYEGVSKSFEPQAFSPFR